MGIVPCPPETVGLPLLAGWCTKLKMVVIKVFYLGSNFSLSELLFFLNDQCIVLV
jgi:hypothetical protein